MFISASLSRGRIILLGEIQDERARGNPTFHFGTAGFWKNNGWHAGLQIRKVSY
jgi:hypothetical protein